MARDQKKTHKLNDCWNSIGVWSFGALRCERLEDVIHCRNCEVFSHAGRSVFERQPPSGYMTQWKKEIASDQVRADSDSVGIMIFRLGREWFALHAVSLHEVIDQRTVHRIPHNERPEIAGVVNVGGEIQVCYSLFDLLDIDTEKTDAKTYKRLIVVINDGDKYVFPVNEISGFFRYSVSDITPVPSTVSEGKKELLHGVIKVNKRQVAALDIEKICQSLRMAVV